MAAEEFVEDKETIKYLNGKWKDLRFDIINTLDDMQRESGVKLHKQIINRLLEPWSHIVVLLSSTFHANFFHLRREHDAQPEIQELAIKMEDIFNSSKPTVRHLYDWHLPLIREEEFEEFSLEDLKKISVGRCARVSYLTHDGVRDPQKDIALHDHLKESGHWSPFEHVATPMPEGLRMNANFRGWLQYRKYFDNECQQEPLY